MSVVHSVNIMIMILLIAVSIVIYYILTYDEFYRTTLLTLMMTTPVMAGPIMEDDMYDQLYEAFEDAKIERDEQWRTSQKTL